VENDASMRVKLAAFLDTGVVYPAQLRGTLLRLAERSGC
jgi:hypothetical protein